MSARQILFECQRFLGVLRLGQGAGGLEVQLSGFGRVAIAILEAADKYLIGLVGEVNGGEQHYRRPLLSARNHHSGCSAGTARDHEAGAAPREILHPHFADGAARCQGDGAGNQPGIDEEVSGDGGNERLRQRQEHHRLEFTTEPLIDESGREHRQRLGADAERRSIPRITCPDVDRALHPDTHERDDERLLRAKEQERHQVRGVPDRQRRTAGERDWKVDLPQ